MVANPKIRIEDTTQPNFEQADPQSLARKRALADERWPPPPRRQQANQRANNQSSKTTTTTTTVETVTTQQKLLTSESKAAPPGYLPASINGTKAPQANHQSSLESVATVEDLGKQASAIDSSSFTGRLSSSSNQASRQTNSLKSQTSSMKSATTKTKLNEQETETQFEGRNESFGGNKMATTISTIAAQSGQSRIVLAMLKDGDSLQLKVQQMRPGIFEVGANNGECIKYVEEHERLMRNLSKQKRTPIDCWMEKYKEIRQFKEPNMSVKRKLVYICMAENLQACWKAVLNQLERRTLVLEKANKFFHQCDVKLTAALNRADNHVQDFRKEFLQGPQSSSQKFNQVCEELKALNQLIMIEYNLAKELQQQLIYEISVVATGNLGDARVNYLISDARDLINYINTYLEPFERRKLQLESVITTTTVTNQKLNILNDENNNITNENDFQSRFKTSEETTTTTIYNDDNSLKNNSLVNKTYIREISNFNDLNLVDNWLNLKIEQLNSSLLSSLGMGAADSRSILNKHEQISLECRAIEEATLTFNGKNIHALKVDNNNSNKSNHPQNGDKSLFEQQKLLAVRARDVITILDVRIILLRRTIDFYVRAKDATADIGRMMRRLQVDNSLQSVQFVSNELELKDVSSVVASGATIISELQQLQLAQQHGQRSRIVNLNLVTQGIRAIIDQLNQDLAHLKTVLSQRRLILLNEDAIKMSNNFLNKCHQLHFWLNNHAKSYLLTNNRLGTDLIQVRNFCDQHEQLRVAVQNKTLEVEALLKSLPTLTENFDPKSNTWDEIQQATDELRQDWISVTNALDRRIEITKSYLAILTTFINLNKELDRLNGSSKSVTPDERTDDDIKSNVDQTYLQMLNQVKNFNEDAQKTNTELFYSAPPTANDHQQQKPVVSDINKQQLVDHTNGLLKQFSNRKQVIENELDVPRSGAPPAPAHQRPQQIDPPRFTRVLSDKTVEPFSTVELECETDEDCQLDWFMNNYKSIPNSIKYVTSSENNQHKLVISNFSSLCCGTYIARATNSAGQAVTQCRLKMAGITESQDEQPTGVNQSGNRGQQQTIVSTISSTTKTQSFQPSSPAISTTSSFSQWRSSNEGADHNVNGKEISRIIRGVESSERDSSQVRVSLLTSDSDTDTTTREASKTPQFPVTQTTYSGSSSFKNNSDNNNNSLRVNYTVESPVSSQSTTLEGRSVSKSPFEGTPQPPVFVQGLTDSMSRCCSRAGLVCLVVGNPPPTIEWLHNNTPIATTKCVKSQTCPRGNICKLTIETMNKCTQGQYVCRASNRLGETSTKLTLTK